MSKRIILTLGLILTVFAVGFAQDETDEEYQKKLEEWKKKKEEIEKRNQEKLAKAGEGEKLSMFQKAAKEAYKAKDYQTAITNYQQALAIQPDWQVGMVNLAVTYKKIGQHDKAIEYYNKAIADNSDGKTTAQATKYLANLYIDIKEYGKAITTLDEYLTTNKCDAPTLALKGQIMKDKMGQLNESIEVFNQALACDEGDEDALYHLAVAFGVKRNYEQAIKYATLAIEKAKTASIRAAAHFELGEAYRKTDNKAKALVHYKESEKDRKWRDSAQYWIKLLK